MINPQGYIMGEKPKNKNPFWDDGEASDVNRIYLTATVDGGTGTPAVESSKTISGNDIIFGLAFKNLKGAPGTDGRPGSDGFSPTATITQDADGATISITDKNGTTTARIANGTPGTPGTPGEDGYSPTASIEPITGGFRLTITDENGSHSVDIMNGTNGMDGDDGFSPIATVEQTGDNEITITITDAQGTTSATLTGEAGRPGEPGTPGEPGAPGADGFSPIATVTQTATGAEISVTDKNGTTTATVNNGTPGTPGTPGVSPTARVDQTGTNEATITVTDAQGTTTARLTGQAGTPGTPGADGFSPIATVTQTSSGAEISITDRNGTTTATVNNGTPGTPGQQGAPGVGVPTGGTAGQVLAKVDGTDYNTEWVTPQSGGGGGMLPAVGTRYTNKGVFIQALQALVPNVGDKKVVFLSGYPLNGSQIMNEYRSSNQDYIQISLSSNYSFYRTSLSVNTGSGAVTGSAQSSQQGSAVALAKGYYLVSRIMWSGSTLYPETEFITITPLACEMENDNVTPLFYASMLYYSVADSELYAYVGRTKKMQYYDSSTIYMDRLSNVLNSPLNVSIAITMATV